MSDPRYIYRDKKLPPMRQPDTAGGDLMQSVTETNRRKLEEAAILTPDKIPSPNNPQNLPGIGTPPFIPLDLRFHKEGRQYVTVSPQHYPGDDPANVLDPAQKHTVNDGYTEAIRLVNLMTTNGDATGRVVMVVFGGEYLEDLTLTNNRIDIQGIGKPIFNGLFTVGAACDVVYVENIVMTNPLGSAFTVAIGTEIPLNWEPPIVFQNCDFIGLPDIGDVYRRVKWIKCRFSTNATGRRFRITYTPSFFYKAIFEECSLYTFLLSTFYPEGTLLSISSFFAGAYIPNTGTVGTGVELRNCQIFTTIANDGWNLFVQGGKWYGAEPPIAIARVNVNLLASCGSIFGSNLTDVNSYSQIDGVTLSSSLIGDSEDTYVANGTANNFIFIRNCNHLLGTTARTYLPPTFAVAQLGLLGLNSGSGIVTVINSSTHATTGWAVAPLVNNVTNSPFGLSVADAQDYFLP